MTASSYPDGGVGEVFLKLGKQGSTLAGVMDAFSMAISVGLQYGIPLESYVAKFTNLRFEPAGMTDDPDIRIATSMMDYIFRRLALDHLPYEQRAELGILSAAERAAELAGQDPATLGVEVDPVTLAQSFGTENNAAHQERTAASAVPAPSAPAAPSASAQANGSVAKSGPHSTAELIEFQQGRTADAPLCLTCGTKMRPAGSCYVCEGCGSTSGCS
jgi:ribonucleoside-diphosphate reductase alpha chain